MNTITLKLTKQQIEKLKNTYIDELSKTPPAYSLYQIKSENVTITAYTSMKVVFQGKDAEIYASAFKNEDFKVHAGSDEVGTGDYFGPVTVCACIVDEQAYKKLSSLKIQDSKTITDDYILDIAPTLINTIPYSLLTLENSKYNEVHLTNNMNAIKAKLHNQAYVHLKNKYGLPKFIVIDQFTPESSYYNYLKHEENVVRNIHFETKAESKYFAVACASIIARYAFLKKWEEMESKYNFKFTKGASDKVDKDGASFIKKFGKEELKNVAKLHFKNTDKLEEYL